METDRDGTVRLLNVGNELESEVGHLTMSPAVDGPCQTAERTLGLGDVLGLESLYDPLS